MNHKIGALTVVALAATCAVAVPRAKAAGTERVEISAPIFPKVLVLYAQEGANYPATLTGEETLAHDAAMTFDTLLTECQAKDATITLASPSPLTAEQLATNYNQVAKCAYENYTVKPYWIPKLVDDVDICATELGADWRLISEDDLAALTDADFQFIADTLTGVAGADAASFSFYFSSRIFVRASDKSIKAGDIAPGVATRVTDLTTSDPTIHYEGGLSLRCIRRTTVVK